MAAYSPYELFRVLIERVGWPDETQKRVALESVDEWERTSIFGNLARDLECDHSELDPYTGRCDDCNKQVTAALRSPRRGAGGWY